MLRSTWIVLLLAAPIAAQEPAAAPLPPEVAASRMTLPEGFRATLFAGEPDVVQPIAFTFDHRGRLWVVECLSYPKWDPNGRGKDRVSIFEDEDGDGLFDSKKVFLDDGGNLSGIAVGYGGVWLCSLPHFLFVPDADGDDVPDAPPTVLLDGWSLECKHNVFNGLTWGPDGWLYGLNGITAVSHVGKPGTPPEDRTPCDCGVWRYHPTRHVFEIVATGTTNPWGLEFDDRGEMFITNCVIEHLFHVVPGGRYERMRGQDPTPHTYDLMPSCADYIHWGGGTWQSSRGGQGIHDAAGGGHAHVGCMIYRGDNWPEQYRGQLFTCNLHGGRVNVDSLHRERSGYQSQREPDFLKANDSWFRGLEMKYGPDGGVYLTDWCDTGECHDYDECDRTNGRIHKLVFGDVKPWKGDLGKLSLAELVALFDHENEWFGRRAQLAFLEQVRRKDVNFPLEVAGALERLVEEGRTPLVRQRALTVIVETGVGGVGTLGYLGHESLEVRAFALRLMIDGLATSRQIGTNLARAAADENVAFVRLNYASILQRLPHEARKPLALALLGRGEDADDPHIPPMLWYAIEPLVEADPAWALEAIKASKMPLVRRNIARRLAAAR
jgi:putative membrane-bound dehydrogenase-like protein